MKKLVLLTVCIFLFAAAGVAQPGINKYKGEKGISSAGIMPGYAVGNKTALFGVDYRYNILDRLRLAPSVLYTLKNDYLNTWYVNADAHYLARITERITIYPVGGIGVSLWKTEILLPPADPAETDPPGETESPGEDESPEETESQSEIRLGLNLGFGGEIRITKDIITGAEFRYNLTKERIYDQAMFLARVAYYF
jgi:opacity protein-like surface antigen